MILLRKEHDKYFKRYNVISLLGKGAYGTVYNVHDTITNETFALKEIKINLDQTKKSINEILPYKIVHPNILYYSPLMISKRPIKLNVLNTRRSRSKSLQNIKFYKNKKQSNSYKTCNINETNQYLENISAIDIFNKNQIRTNKKYDPNMKSKCDLEKHLDYKVCNLDCQQSIFGDDNLRSADIQKTRSWGVSREIMENSTSKSQSADCEYFLYLKTRICAFSLRDFIDVRNKKIFATDKDTEVKSICYNGILNTNVEIPYDLCTRSICDKNMVCKKFSYGIFKCILLGLLFLHSLGISHNDLKTSNIFMDGNDSFVPKIGDFGSKTICNHYEHSDTQLASSYPYNINNRTYLNCDHNNNNKVQDCRSLGIILIELLYPFKTHSEMIDVTRCVKESGQIPEFIKNEYPDEFNLLQKILTDPNISVKKILSYIDKILT